MPTDPPLHDSLLNQLSAFGQTLERVAAEPVRAANSSADPEVPHAESRAPAPWKTPLLVAACVAVLVAGLGFALRSSGSERLETNAPDTVEPGPPSADGSTLTTVNGAAPLAVGEAIEADPLGLIADGGWALSDRRTEAVDLMLVLGVCAPTEGLDPLTVPILTETYLAAESDEERYVTYVVGVSSLEAERVFEVLTEFNSCVSAPRNDGVQGVDITTAMTFVRPETVTGLREAEGNAVLNVWAATNVVVGVGGPGPGGEFTDEEVVEMHERALAFLDRLGAVPPVGLPDGVVPGPPTDVEPIETAVGQTANVDVTGSAESSALDVMAQQGLQVVVTSVEVEPDSDDDGRVLAQVPAPGGAVEIDSTVELFVGRSIVPEDGTVGTVIEPSPIDAGERAPAGFRRSVGAIVVDDQLFELGEQGWELEAFVSSDFDPPVDVGCAADAVLAEYLGTRTHEETWTSAERGGLVLSGSYFVFEDVADAARVFETVAAFAECERFTTERQAPPEPLTSAALGLTLSDSLTGVWAGPTSSIISSYDGTNVVIVSSLVSDDGAVDDAVVRQVLVEVHERNLITIERIGPGQAVWPTGGEPPQVSGVFEDDVRSAFDSRGLDVTINYRLVAHDDPKAGRAIEVVVEPDGSFSAVLGWSRSQPVAFRDRSAND